MILHDVITKNATGDIVWKKLDVTPTAFRRDAIGIIETRYGGKYLLETEYCDKNGNWSNNPGLLFYQPDPKTELGHSHYFIIYKDPKTRLTKEPQIMICDGQPTVDRLTLSCVENNSVLIYSHYRHHFHGSPIAIDGGRSYTRLIGDGIRVAFKPSFKVVDGRLEEISNLTVDNFFK